MSIKTRFKRLSPMILMWGGIGTLIFCSGCSPEQPESYQALSVKNAVVMEMGEEPSDGGVTLSDSLLGGLFPDWKEDWQWLEQHHFIEEVDWLIGLQYVQQQGWLPTFVAPWQGRESLAESRPDLLIREYATFRGVSLVQVEERFFAAITRGFVIFGRMPLLVEDAIRELDGGVTNWKKDPFVQRQWRERKGMGRRVLFLSQEFLSLWKPTDWLISGLSNSEWMDITLRDGEGKVILEGILAPEEEPKVSKKGSGLTWLPSFLPENIVLFRWVNTLPKAAGPYPSSFEQWWDGEVALFQPAGQPHPIFALRIIDHQLAQQKLDALAAQLGVISQEEYQTFSIRQLLDDRILQQWHPAGVRNPYYTLIGDYVVFAATRSALTVCIDYYLTGRPSAHLPALFDTLDTEATHLNWFRIAALSGEDLPFSELAWIEKPNGEQSIISGWALFTPPPTSALNLRWKFPLDADIVSGPFVVGGQDGGTVIFIAQDAAGFIYGLDAGGRLLWRKHLDGKIVGEVKTLEGKAQTLVFFTTSNRVYTLDMTGNFLSGFPVDLPARAATGVQVIDFDSTGTPALLVSTIDGSIYGFDQVGRLLTGWNPNRHSLPLRFPPAHLQEDYRDLLIGVDLSDSVLIWSRQGKPLLPGWRMDTLCLSPPQLSEGSPRRMVFIDVSGKGTAMNSSGIRTPLNFPERSSGKLHWIYLDISGADQKEYISQDGWRLSGFSDQRKTLKKLFTYTFDQPQDTLFAVNGPLGDKALIGVLNRQRRQLHLLDGRGRLLPFFPIAADRPAVSVANQQGQLLIVTGLGRDMMGYGWMNSGGVK